MGIADAVEHLDGIALGTQVVDLLPDLGGIGGVSFMSQLLGTILGIVIAVAGGWLVYGILKKTVGIRLDPEEEYEGADLSVHKISATPEREVSW